MHQGVSCITHEAKAAALHEFFTRQFGSTTPREHTLNWDVLRPMQHDLQELDREVTEEEIQAAVIQTLSEKALGLDGYIGGFYKACWDIIKVEGIKEIFSLRPACWNLLNSVHIVLMEKKEGGESIGGCRSISIMHSTTKLLVKILANRLAPHLDKLVSRSQSAFIKAHSIQDNFQYVKGAANHFHQAKAAVLMLKLDIAKAFDNVHWEYLLEVMQHLGFGQYWRDLIALIWSITTSRVLLNGAPGRPIKHVRGLRQGTLYHPCYLFWCLIPPPPTKDARHGNTTRIAHFNRG
jgi:hypothetical protein